MNTAPRLLAALALSALLIGCSAPQTGPNARATIEIMPADYDRAIDAAREVLIDNRFTIDRVDARRGIITTLPKHSAGLGSPWDQEQSTLDQEWADLVHHHERVIRISFDRDVATQSTQVHVLASIVRIRRPGWRLETESIRQSTHATSITTNSTRVPSVMREPIGEDTALSARIADEIRNTLGLSASASQVID